MLDTKEIFLVAALLCLLIFMVLFSVKESRIKGVNALLGAAVLGVVANVLYAFGRELPALISYELANAAYASASAVLLVGYRQLFRQPVSARVLGASVILLTALVAFFHYSVNSFTGRTVVVSIYQVGITACIAYTALRSRRDWANSRFPAAFVVGMSLVAMAGHSFRALYQMFATSSPNSLLEPSGWNGAMLAAGALVLPVLALGGLLVTHRRIVAMVEHAANRDFLTEAWSRRAFFENGEREMFRAGRTGRPLAVLLMDLDDLKLLNDVHGHAAGDEALIAFVARTEHELRAIDCLARIGGDEFAVLMPETDLAGALMAAERLISRVRIAKGERDKIEVTFSVGIAVLRQGDSLTSMVKRADAALYRAKSSGRNCVMVEQPERRTEGAALCN